jgi:hypothetical protein
MPRVATPPPLPSSPLPVRAPAVVRIWDAFLCEGAKVVYRVSLAVLLCAQGEGTCRGGQATGAGMGSACM